MNNLEFMSKFKPEIRCVKDFEYWIVCVRERQVTLGNVVIILKRQIDSLGNMTSEESAEFPKIVKWYEEICRKKFGAIKFNYSVLMMKDNFVHYHAFPRYDKSIKLFGIDWFDTKYPESVDLSNAIVPDEKILNEIRDFIKNI